MQTTRRHLGAYWHIWTLSILTAAFLLLQYDRFYNILSWADTDDALQYNLSQNIVNGNWLGGYNRFTLIKGVGFPAWTALLHTFHVPLWLGNSALTILACAAVVYALRSILAKRWLIVVTYSLLLFNPMITARVYRDDIIPAITLLICAWIFGMFLTLTDWHSRKPVIRKGDAFLFTLIGTISLPAWYYTREDPSWLLPLIGVLVAITAAYYICRLRHHLKDYRATLATVILLLIIPFITVQAVGIGIANLNKHYYGRYVVNDYFSKDFENAYATLSRVTNVKQKPITVPITYAMRQKIYAASPSFKALQPCLDGVEGVCEGFKQAGPNKALRDYEGGWMPFAIRFAVERAGYYRNATAANAYYTRLTDEVNQACKSGRLQCQPVHMVAFLPLPNKPILKTFSSNLVVSYKFLLPMHYGGDDYSPVAIPQTADSDKIAQYYDVRYTTPQLGRLGQDRKNIRETIHTLYADVTPLLFLVSIMVLLVTTIVTIRRRLIVHWRLLTIGWLLFLTLLLRIAMLSYVQTVSFPTIYPLYFAAVYPLLFLFEGLSLSMLISLVRQLRTKSR